MASQFRPGSTKPAARTTMGVVIVNFRGADDTIECLESLLRSTIRLKVVVVENGSGDGSADRILAWAKGEYSPSAGSPGLAALSTPAIRKPMPVNIIAPAEIGTGSIAALTLIVSPDNLGFAGGNNLGLRHLLTDPAVQYFWLLNNDAVVIPDCAEALANRMLAIPRVGMCGTVVRQYWQPDRLQALGGYSFSPITGMGRALGGNELIYTPYNPQDIAEATDFVLGASLAVSRPFLEQVGLMEETYFLYYEEMDWAMRNRRLGDEQMTTGFAHGAVVYHKAGASIGSPNATQARSAFSDYWMARSRIRFTARFFPLLLPLHIALTWAMAARRLIRRRPDNAKALIRASLGLRMR
ncbi:glycosyltransferase family 2 protein [Sandarakinorhabdus sp.]|uniref:glycosyltransferase family 2 protein n=1 Tax=Sandarakinorhabdus sp. TaxID=1916663 RepID=UPI00334167AE